MIKATELRLGNYVSAVSSGSAPVQITRKNLSHILTSEWTGTDIIGADFSINPIPLTEEWLEKFGFENKGEVQPAGYFLNYVPIRFQYDVGWYDLGYDGIYHKIEYVHQLQNLYFALTGNELTVQEYSIK